MIPGFFAAGAAGGAFIPEFTDGIALPLTFGESDYNGLLSWSRQGGPLPSPAGGVFDNAQARLMATAGLPGWVTSPSGPLTIQATLAPQNCPHTAAAMAVGVCVNNAGANPKLAIAVVEDSYHDELPVLAAQAYTSSLQSVPVVRKGWRFEFRHPEIMLSGNQVRPQGVHFLDAGTLLVTGYYETSVISRCHKVRLSDGVSLGHFDFDTADTGPNHINAIAEASDGSVWFAGNGKMFRVDLDASFASGEAVITSTYSITPFGSFLAIATISGTEYVIGGQYLTSGTPYIVVFPFSLVSDGGSFDISQRTNRYVINQRMQGIRYYAGKLYATLNRTTAESTAPGWIHEYTLDLGASDGSSLVVPDAAWPAPSQYPEDLDFHPTTGDVYTSTEGYSSVGSSEGWLSVWSSPLDESLPENTVALEYNGAGSVAIKVNGRDFETRAWTPTPTPGAVSIGGKPQAVAAWDAGFYSGTIKNVIVQQGAMSASGYRTAVEGYYEPSALSLFPVTLVNPGCETGDTTGWTDEVGALGIRPSHVAPGPHTGHFFFFGGPNPATISRQRVEIASATGLSATEIDAGGLWVRVSWWQASFSATDTDVATMGLRMLDAAQVEQAKTINPKLRPNPHLTWLYRTHSLEVPIGARYVDALFDMTRFSGTNLDGYFDDVTLEFFRRP